MPRTAPGLGAIAEYVSKDPGLIASISRIDIEDGVDAAQVMNTVITTAIDATGVNRDGRLTPADLELISAYIRDHPKLYADFVRGHGDDEGSAETGFHLVQGDGGTLEFQGRAFVDTIGDAVYHVGFKIVDGRFRNEDGDANEKVDDVAGWLNYFVNGTNIVYGTSGNETLYSDDYSPILSDAADELFLAGAGDDRVWANDGDDTVYASSGNDTVGGGAGSDQLRGGSGNDKIYGEAGNDTMLGQAGADKMSGGTGNDTMIGGSGKDTLWGEKGNDRIIGGSDGDRIGGGSGDDNIYGGTGRDILMGDDGDDSVRGDEGDDQVWGQSGDDKLYGGDGDDRMGGGIGDDRMLGGSGADTVYGEDGDDYVSGGSGDDLVDGMDGSDMVRGGGGVDTIAGGDGHDTIDGGTGADVIKDWETVDAADTFVFRPGDTGRSAGERDVILGFDEGLDVIDLQAFGGLSYRSGEVFSSMGKGEVLFDDGYVLIDDDGDGNTDAAIELRHVRTMEADDFVL